MMKVDTCGQQLSINLIAPQTLTVFFTLLGERKKKKWEKNKRINLAQSMWSNKYVLQVWAGAD